MTTTRGVFIFVLAIFVFLPQTTAAQQQTAQATVEQELHTLGLRTSEAVELLRELVYQRAEEQKLKRLQVAVLALQLRSTAISDIEERIRTLEDRVVTASEELAQLDAELERINSVFGLEKTPQAQRERLASSRTKLESRIDVIKNRIWTYERQILDVQNELSTKRRDVSALEEVVMEGLSEF